MHSKPVLFRFQGRFWAANVAPNLLVWGTTRYQVIQAYWYEVGRAVRDTSNRKATG